MKTIVRIAGFIAIFMAVSLFGQTFLGPKDTPASRTLDEIAKQYVPDQKALDDKKAQAQAALDQSNTSLTKQIGELQKALQDKLKADKKYAPLLQQIEDLNKKFASNQIIANQAFQADAGPLAQKVTSETGQLEGLEKAVRQENGWPDTATYDRTKQKWSMPEKK